MPDLGLNFRRFLGGQEKPADPPTLTELAELKEGQAPSTGHFATPIANPPTPPTTSVSTDPKARKILAGEKKVPARDPVSQTPNGSIWGKREPLDPRAWVSQRTRDARAGWADYIDRPF